MVYDIKKYIYVYRPHPPYNIGVFSCMDITAGDVNDKCTEEKIPAWSGSNSVVNDEKMEQRQVGFLPVLPSPVTKPNTVYTALKNIQDVLKQLSQNAIAVSCDEGVYHIAREIMLNRQHEFANIVLCLGSFHMIKIVLSCIGKYIEGSGAEKVFVENGIFGANVVKSVIAGSHYERSLTGMIMLGEVIERMQWKEFLSNSGNLEKYVDDLAIIQQMKDAFAKHERDKTKEYLKNFVEDSDPLREAFKNHKIEMATKSETFAFWNNFVTMVALLRDLVRADRVGNWALHLNSLQQILPLFVTCD